MAQGSGGPRSRFTQELPLLLKVLMIFRVATVSVLLGVTVLIQVKGSQVLFYAPLFTVYLIIVTVYLLTILFASLFHEVRNLPRFAFMQVGVDLILYTLIVFYTGGHGSPFPFLYLFTILWAALAMKGGGYWTASLSSILYGGVVDLQYYRVLLPPNVGDLADIMMANPWDIMGRISLHIIAFYAVAFLGHQIGHRYRTAREELSEKTVDLEKLRTLSDVVFESITSGIAVLDGRGHIRSINTAAVKMLGLEKPPPMGSSVSEVFPGIPVEDLLGKAPERGLNRWEGTYRDDRGQDRTLGLSISPLKEPERGHVMIFQDLTELREMEIKLRTTEKLSAIGRMAASIAHEVRNPLASVSGSIQMLKSDLQLDGENLQLMDIVLKETERLNDLVGDFLVYARPPTPRFEDEDLRSVVLDTVKLMKNTSLGTGITLTTELPDEEVILSVDSSQMRQVLMNLIKNAADALGEGGRITVSLKRADGDGGSAGDTLLCVADDGPGISEDVLPRIFEPFITSKSEGTGLGLAIVYQLVQIHKGSIDIQTRAGKGTTVLIRLAPWRNR